MKDAECIGCGRAFASFGTVPLCTRCTRAHAAHLPPLPRIAPTTSDGPDILRACVRVLNNTHEGVNQLFTPSELVKLYEALKRSAFDITWDHWTDTEIRDALSGHGTGATSER